MNSSYLAVDLLLRGNDINESLNRSGVLLDFPVDDLPILLNSVSYISEEIPNDILLKIKKSIV